MNVFFCVHSYMYNSHLCIIKLQNTSRISRILNVVPLPCDLNPNKHKNERSFQISVLTLKVFTLKNFILMSIKIAMHLQIPNMVLFQTYVMNVNFSIGC